MAEPAKQYDPKKHEAPIYAAWEKAGVFRPNKAQLDAGKKPFVIMLPPPNITGNLHMGHALQDTVMDILSRWHRLMGEPVLWLPGTDHAAISTNRVLEKQLAAEGTTRQDIGREKFLERADSWYEKTGAVILNQMRRLGSSCDWTRERFTMDKEYYQAVQHAFVEYYKKGYIYRGNRMVNWCPHCESVVSDLEIVREDRPTKLVTLRYPLVDGTGEILVATTRPETMLGDTAVAVHPDDDRYASLVGNMVRLPIIGREIPIIADGRIDKTFGTGAVKVTPAHDMLDSEIGATHKLPVINVIDERGIMTASAGRFAGVSVEEARIQIMEGLRQEDALFGAQDYQHAVALCERCGTVIEPLISRQWFVDMQKLKEATIQVARDGLVGFVPPRWENHFIDWMEHVHDWTISRQIWLGHQIPVWWKKGTRGTEQEEGNFVVAIEQPEGHSASDDAQYEQDPDVLDTWFSSALWPFATLGWPNNTKDLQAFYPTSVLVTGRDILYLWVARMVFSGLEFMQGEQYGSRKTEKRIPFRHVFVHPTVLTRTGQRMSKSLGTGVDPLDLVEQYGADATRFGLMYQMNYDSQAIRFDEEAIKASRNFANKLWNISKLLASFEDRKQESAADEWMVGRLNETISAVTTLLEEYKFGEAARLLHGFVWGDYADWYLEIVKTEGSTATAKEVFEKILVLLHPFMPYVTEVLWSQHGKEGMVAQGSWPKANNAHDGQESKKTMRFFQDIVSAVRSARVLLGIKPNAIIEAYVEDSVPLPLALKSMARVNIAAGKTSDMRQFPLPTAGNIFIASDEITPESLQAARTRLAKEEDKARQLLASTEGILKNMEGKASLEKIAEKQAVMAQMRQKLDELAASKNLLG